MPDALTASADQRKIAASRIAVLVAGVLGVAKLAVGLATGSLVVIASAADSLVDLVVSSMNVYALSVASQPPDREHRFGHGKAEGIAALVQALLLAVVGALVAGEAVRRIVYDVTPSATLPALVVMIGALLATVLLVRHMQRVARETQSLALAADARHYTSDVLVNLGAIAGLALYQITPLPLIDPLISLAITGPILHSAWVVFRSATDDLMDRELPDPDREKVKALIHGMGGPVLGYHGLRTRKSGTHRYMELRLHVAQDVSFEEAHRLTHVLEEKIKAEMPGVHVTVHAEPVTRQGERVHVD